MEWLDILILSVIAVAFASVVGFGIYKKVTGKGGNGCGCDCGGSCNGCPHCSANVKKHDIKH